MKVLFTSIGTRGDVEPLLAIAVVVQTQGNKVLCMFPEQFRHLANDSGIAFESLGSEFIEMLDSPAGRIAMGGGSFGLKKIKAYKTLISMQQEISKNMLLIQEEVINRWKPDRICLLYTSPSPRDS